MKKRSLYDKKKTTHEMIPRITAVLFDPSMDLWLGATDPFSCQTKHRSIDNERESWLNS